MDININASGYQNLPVKNNAINNGNSITNISNFGFNFGSNNNFAAPPLQINNIIGTRPEYLNQKRKLGSGMSKTVFVVSASKKSLGNTDKTGWKDIALAKQTSNNSKNQAVELYVLKKLSEEETAKFVTPKIYYAGRENGQLITATKLISGGEARHCLPNMSFKAKLEALIGYCHGLELLHNKNIIHNDTALRNMLIELPTETKQVDEALNFRLAKPIFDENGKTLIESKELITAEIQSQIKDLGLNQVKVFANKQFNLDSAVQDVKVMQDFELESFNNRGRHSQMVKVPPVVNDSGSKDCVNLPSSTAESRFKGFITDFDRCTSINNDVEVELGFPIDSTAPERMYAFEQYKKIKQINLQNTNKQNEIEARNKVLLASNPKTDAFSLGQLLCDAILRPDLNTSLDASNYTYLIMCAKRQAERLQKYEDLLSNGTLTESTSAIDQNDYQELCKINADLALLAFNLLNYNLDMRPSISEATTVLENVFENCTDLNDPSIIFDNIFKPSSIKEQVVVFSNQQDLPVAYDD